ncbi:hypothetical protein ACFL6M_00530 [Candidatus Eisenbacteria bacterium]|uniref:DUF7670 domain-containing protein n=1 Tax=Eiseniibacteriota bacterium TaxID=2212470 RepID=A0ABV6YI97_UNCEI
MTETKPASGSPLRSLKWIARILGTLFVLFVLFALPYALNPDGPDGPPPNAWPSSWGLMALFPFGVAAGFIVGWFRPLMGGVLALVCLAAGVVLPQIPLRPGVQAVVLAAIAVLFVFYGVLDGNRRREDSCVEQ